MDVQYQRCRLSLAYEISLVYLSLSYLFGTFRRRIRQVWSSHGPYFGETKRASYTADTVRYDLEFNATKFSQKSGDIFSSYGNEICLANCVEPLLLILFWSSTPLSSSSSGIFLTRLFGVSFSKFSNLKFSEKFGNSDSIISV